MKLFAGILIGMAFSAVIVFAAHEASDRETQDLLLTDMYLKPPPGQMQGMDPNDLAVRQAWTSSVIRQTCIKIQQDVQALGIRIENCKWEMSDPNDTN